MAASNTIGAVMAIGAVLAAVEALRLIRSSGTQAAGAQAGGRLTGSHAPFGAGTPTGQIVAQALKDAGAPADWLDGMMQVLSHEDASGDPAAKNPIPVNGEHAQGLFQFLPSTFAGTRARHNLGPGNIIDGYDNALTAVYYIRDLYGSPTNIAGLYKPNCPPGTPFGTRTDCWNGY